VLNIRKTTQTLFLGVIQILHLKVGRGELTAVLVKRWRYRAVELKGKEWKAILPPSRNKDGRKKIKEEVIEDESVNRRGPE